MNIKELLNEAIKNNASDIHLIVGLKPVLRIDGELKYIDKVDALSQIKAQELIFSILTKDQKNKFLEKKGLDFSYDLNGNRFRINLHFEKNNIGLVARVISNEMPTLEMLNMPDVVYDLLNLNQGLILVTGPTGCGKSTTLAAMINHINQNKRCSIVTLEDPIEYIFKPKESIIIQRQLGSDMLNYSEGLKHVLRQDPNVVMVGEMRDLETIATTITLAETGHLVLATLHTYSAAQTIDRIIDTFPPHQQNQVRTQLSMTLACVISQRLLPSESGGRVAAREIMINTPAVANLIRENKISQIGTILETGAKNGMFSLDQDLKKLYKNKIITKEIAQLSMKNPETLGR